MNRKQSIKSLLQYLPWLLLLLGVYAFAALILWIADIQAFRSMSVVMLLAALLFFSVVCFVLIRQEQKKKQAFSDFLHDPDAYHEEILRKAVSRSSQASIRLLGRILRDRQNDQARLQTQIGDQEEYVESWAHEIKTPISLLTLLLDNRRDELSDELGYKLDHIRNRLQESVDQMLFYARLKGFRKDYLFEHLPVLACLEEVLEDYHPLLHEKQFRIRFELSEYLVYSDRRGLHFLLGQIISNSIKYCVREPELSFSSSQKDGRYVLRIQDNGIGMRSCDLPWIFEKGFTGDSGNGRKTATGMGLYLANEMAKELNLTLEARSQWGEGFEMQISFPIVQSD